MPDWGRVHKELRRKSVTLQLLWMEYGEAHPDGYGYSQFCNLYRPGAATRAPAIPAPAEPAT